MPGIYIHIPFCKQACYYCDFHFSTSPRYRQEFIQAMLNEIKNTKDYLDGKTINTIYFGGGTPSLLNEEELNQIIDFLHRHHHVSPAAEVTLEANPDDLDKTKTSQLIKAGINRLSVGIQSFYNEHLTYLNRSHDASRAIDSVKISQDAGFQNINIDLIYGIQNLSDTQWINNLEQAYKLKIQHISSYSLTVEPKTALSHFIKTDKYSNLDDNKAAVQFELMLDLMHSNEFEQYEISNFCKEGYYSKHNSSYWMNETYLGLGPSAHSFNGISRRWNVSNNAVYIRNINAGERTHEEELLSPDQRYNEYVLTGMRTKWGISLQQVNDRFGNNYLKHCMDKVQPFIDQGHVLQQNDKVLLSQQGKLICDKISLELFV